MSSLIADCGITGTLTKPVDMVSVARRVSDDHEYLFVLNFSKEAREITLTGEENLIDLESGNVVSTSLSLAGLESRVLKRLLP